MVKAREKICRVVTARHESGLNQLSFVAGRRQTIIDGENIWRKNRDDVWIIAARLLKIPEEKCAVFDNRRVGGAVYRQKKAARSCRKIAASVFRYLKNCCSRRKSFGRIFPQVLRSEIKYFDCHRNLSDFGDSKSERPISLF